MATRTGKHADDCQPPGDAREVTKEEFFKAIGPLDVHPKPLGDYPYLSEFRTRAGFPRGWIKDGVKYGKPNYGNRYYLPR